jgi:hypothetical protein
MITEARAHAARSVNAGTVMLYRRLGQWIQRDILRQKRAA